jgi:hypothetical protein
MSDEDDSDHDALVTEHINNQARAANEVAEWLATVAKKAKEITENPEIKFQGPAAGQAINFMNGMTKLTENMATDAGRLSWNMYVQQAADAEKNQNP